MFGYQIIGLIFYLSFVRTFVIDSVKSGAFVEDNLLSCAFFKSDKSTLFSTHFEISTEIYDKRIL